MFSKHWKSIKTFEFESKQLILTFSVQDVCLNSLDSSILPLYVTYCCFVFLGMAKRYSAQEVAELLMNDDGEIDSADSLDEEFSSDAESTSQSEIESDESDYAGRKVLQNITPEGHPRGRGTATVRGGARVRGGLSRRAKGRRRGIRTRGGLQSVSRQPEKRKRNTVDSDNLEDSHLEEHPSEDDKENEGEQAPNQDEDEGDEVPNGDGEDDYDEKEYEWSDDNPTIKQFTFNEDTGLKIEAPDDDNPLFFFNLFVNDELLQQIEDRSNYYAAPVINTSRPLRRSSVLNTWKDVTFEETKQFFGLVFHMGIVAMPSYRSYWSKDRLYSNKLFKSVMSRNWFQSIMRFLIFGEEPTFQDDRLRKIRFLLNHLNNATAEVYTPDKDLSLDESMMLWRGRLVFSQYIKSKRHKYGVKFFELYTNDGFVLKTEIYSGTKFADIQSMGQNAAIVIHLMNPYLDKGYHVFTDNWYNSVPLTKYMSDRKTYITGTLRADRKHQPEAVSKKKLKKGEMVFQPSDDITITKWKDKRDVRMITNVFVPEIVETVNRYGKTNDKPNVVDVYNQNMSGIDRPDQMLSYHSGLRKTIRWYKNVGVHIMEILLANALYLYFKLTPSPKIKSMREFKECVIRNLIGKPKPKKHMVHIHHILQFEVSLVIYDVYIRPWYSKV